MRMIVSLLEYYGINVENIRVCFNFKKILRKFFLLWNEGEEIYNLGRIIGIEYSIYFFLGLIIF